MATLQEVCDEMDSVLAPNIVKFKIPRTTKPNHRVLSSPLQESDDVEVKEKKLQQENERRQKVEEAKRQVRRQQEELWRRKVAKKRQSEERLTLIPATPEMEEMKRAAAVERARLAGPATPLQWWNEVKAAEKASVITQKASDTAYGTASGSASEAMEDEEDLIEMSINDSEREELLGAKPINKKTNNIRHTQCRRRHPPGPCPYAKAKDLHHLYLATGISLATPKTPKKGKEGHPVNEWMQQAVPVPPSLLELQENELLFE